MKPAADQQEGRRTQIACALKCIPMITHSLSFANSEFTFSNNLRLNSLLRIGFNGLAFLTASSRLIRRSVCIFTRILTGGIGAPRRSEAVVLKVKLHGCVCRVQAPRGLPSHFVPFNYRLLLSRTSGRDPLGLWQLAGRPNDKGNPSLDTSSGLPR
jgi:hypothetical protein